MLRSGQAETPGRTLAAEQIRPTDANPLDADGPRSGRAPGACAPATSPPAPQSRTRRPPPHAPTPDMESIREFLKDLPSYDKQNFTLFNTDNGIRTCSKRPSVYLPTTEFPSEQIIVTEKTNILLRYLHQQWEKKNSKKRDGNIDNSGLDECRPKKRLRLNSP